MSGSRFSVNYTECKLSRNAIVNIFNYLSRVTSGSQTVTVTRNPGTSELTGADIAIANGKGWNVVT
jgi:hypothetical protein